MGMKPAARGSYNPEKTRVKIIEAALNEFHINGFRSADMVAIMKNAGVSKGAMYHHFKGGKQSLGYAVVEEALREVVLQTWVLPIEQEEDRFHSLINVIKTTASEPCDDVLSRGCPLFNLASEMSPIDEGFRTRLEAIFNEWRDSFAHAIEDGRKKGIVRPDIDPQNVATFVIGAMEGAIAIAKNAQDHTVLRTSMQTLISYLESLEAQPIPA